MSASIHLGRSRLHRLREDHAEVEQAMAVERVTFDRLANKDCGLDWDSLEQQTQEQEAVA